MHMNDDITLFPFTLSMESDREITIEKGKPIPFNRTEIDRLSDIDYDLETHLFKVLKPGDYYVSYQMKTNQIYHLTIVGDVDFFDAELFPVENISHGSGIITVSNENVNCYLTCKDHDILLENGKQATITFFKVR